MLEFRNNFPGLWWSYEDEKNFPEVVRQNLTNFIVNKFSKSKSCPDPQAAGANLEDNITRDVQKGLNELRALIGLLRVRFPNYSNEQIYKLSEELLRTHASRGSTRESEHRSDPMVGQGVSH